MADNYLNYLKEIQAEFNAFMRREIASEFDFSKQRRELDHDAVLLCLAACELKSDVNDEGVAVDISAGIETLQRFQEAVEYSLFAGGKQIRPLFFLLWSKFWLSVKAYKEVTVLYDEQDCSRSVQVAGVNRKLWEIALYLASALEMIHNYSLIHDDLPAMDNADYRRNRLSNHRKYNEAIAILAGDSLLTAAAKLITRSFALASEIGELPFIATLSAAAGHMTDAAGIGGMISGQVLDLEIDPSLQKPEDYLLCIQCKTAAMLQSAFRIPAELFAANEEYASTLRYIGSLAGLLFQIQDDRLDADTADVENNILRFLSLEKLVNLEGELSSKLREALHTLFGQVAGELKRAGADIVTSNQATPGESVSAASELRTAGAEFSVTTPSIQAVSEQEGYEDLISVSGISGRNTLKEELAAEQVSELKEQMEAVWAEYRLSEQALKYFVTLLERREQ